MPSFSVLPTRGTARPGVATVSACRRISPQSVAGLRTAGSVQASRPRLSQVFLTKKTIRWTASVPGKGNHLEIVAMAHADLPAPRGLYDPANEKDACGVGFIAELDGVPKREVVEKGIEMLIRLNHRGACGCETNTGDGAGVLVGIPHAFFHRVADDLGISLPQAGDYAVGMVYFPGDPEGQQRGRGAIEGVCKELGHTILGWRRVPTDNSMLGKSALDTEPDVEQFFVTRTPTPCCNTDDSEREFFVLRRLIGDGFRKAGLTQEDAYMCSLSAKTIVYKGQLMPTQVPQYFPDLSAHDFESVLCLVHSRFSTNTFPSWNRAQPMRLLGHNGEINTLRGNKNWMKARQGVMTGGAMNIPREIVDRMQDIVPVEQSDSGSFDAVLELLVRSGRDLPEAMMIMIPEAWQGSSTMAQEKKDFYQYHSAIMEPWDGPALVAFTDGRYIGATLDRNGLRPGRYHWTKTRVVMASEVGVVDTPFSEMEGQGRLQGGNLLFVDLQEGRLITDDEVKHRYCNLRPYREWLSAESATLQDMIAFVPKDAAIPPAPLGADETVSMFEDSLHSNGNGNGQNGKNGAHSSNGNGYGSTGAKIGARVNGALNGSRPGSNPDMSALDKKGILRILKPLKAFGYTQEELEIVMATMGQSGAESLGSMGNDAPLAFMSRCPQLVYKYFKQLFAQVTNPPLDAIREKLVTSVRCMIGPEGDVTGEPNPGHAARLELLQPILSATEMEAFKKANFRDWRIKIIDTTWPVSEGVPGLRAAVERVQGEAASAVEEGYSFVVLSDRRAGPDRCAVSALIACGAVHHHLVHLSTRTKVGVLVDSGEPREVHHFALLLGYGADGICPYLAEEAFVALSQDRTIAELTREQIVGNYHKSICDGVLKVMAKMGISTLASYKGAQIFEALGLSAEVVDVAFRGTPSRIGGVTWETLAKDLLRLHSSAYSVRATENTPEVQKLANPGEYFYRVPNVEQTEPHLNDPQAIALLQDACRERDFDKGFAKFQKFAELNTKLTQGIAIRGMLEFDYSGREPVTLEEVESWESIAKRFCTGAMSYGSISMEAHVTLARAMNKIGGKSNTGEGGENPNRLYLNEDGSFNTGRSAIKQVASGRFGVTAEYLTHAQEIQIKMAQGAKPGEGGELPGSKVKGDIAKTRHSTAGVGLISPPPHHDIYSIEDLAQLIYDLHAANPAARVSVKLVSENGVGVVAAGVVKAKADGVLISGHDGGTGAAKWTSIKHAGLPWELGLAEAHQTLVANRLRDRARLQVDGTLRTGRDLLTASLLGAEEWGLATAPLIVMGCIMLRRCHTNECSVGIATQDPELRAKFAGRMDDVVQYFHLLAEDLRRQMAKLGFRTVDEMVGHAELLKVNDAVIHANPKLANLDLSRLLVRAEAHTGESGHICTALQDHGLETGLDPALLPKVKEALKLQLPIVVKSKIVNENRAVGTTISHEVVKAVGRDRLPDNHIRLQLSGHGGQSLGAFLARGVTVEVVGDANDYVGKGLSGGIIVVKPPEDVKYKAEEALIVGNVCLYGATEGEAYFRGRAAERFCVRNSGATAVAEGCGLHGLEYMTGGTVVILGAVEGNFGAGMSGGIAYVYNTAGDFERYTSQDLKGALIHDLSAKDEGELTRILNKHLELTQSTVAAGILGTWADSKKHFVKVFPVEYRKALEAEEAKAQEQILEVDPEVLARIDGMEVLAESVRGWKDLIMGLPEPAPLAAVGPIKAQKERLQHAAAEGLWVAGTPMPWLDTMPKEVPMMTAQKSKGFLNYQRQPVPYRDPVERVNDYNEVQEDVLEHQELIMTQASRCMNCGTPFCHQVDSGCPLGNKIPEWNLLISQNRMLQAWIDLRQTNPFPEFTGMVCPAPCENACTVQINQPAVAIKSNEIWLAQWARENGLDGPNPPAMRSGRRVAVVGSGPAGLTVAFKLNQMGHEVVVFEGKDRCGGLMMYGIPNMKIDKGLVQRRLNMLAEEGIKFVTHARVGDNLDPKELTGSFDATVLAVGAMKPRDLQAEGREGAKGIHFAMEFLEANTRSLLNSNLEDGKYISCKGKKVVVIGGGDTGTDCIATALRHGATEIINLELMPEPPAERRSDNPWPQWMRIKRIDYGHAEAFAKWGKDPRRYSVSAKSVVTHPDGHVTGLKIVKVEFKDGRPTEVPDTEVLIECDLVFLSMGFLGPEQRLAEILGVEVTERSNYKADVPDKVDNLGFATNVRGVFATGDCRKGQSLVVHAINEGMGASTAIDDYLEPYTLSAEEAAHVQGGFSTVDEYNAGQRQLATAA